MALEDIAGNEVRFLAFGRTSGDRFLGLDDVELPPRLRSLSTGVPEAEFRVDISSTEVRQTA